MLSCVHCNQDITDTAQAVAYEILGSVSGRRIGVEWAHLPCEAAATHTPEGQLVALQDGETYLTLAQMENAAQAHAELLAELRDEYLRGGCDPEGTEDR